MRRRRVVLYTFLLLVGIVVAVPVVLTWRQLQREQLNRALIAAVDGNDVTAVRRLLHQGADPNASILPVDRRPVWQRMWDMLRRRSSPQPVVYESALMLSVEWLPNPQDESVVIDNADTVQALVQAGARVNLKGGKEPFRRPTTPAVEAAYWGKWNTVRVLLAHHAEVDATDSAGTTALMFAAGAGNTDVAEELLVRGAKIDAKDCVGETALYYGLRDCLGRTPLTPQQLKQSQTIVGFLLRNGASVQVTTTIGKDSYTVLEWARFCDVDKRLIQMLHQAGAKEKGKQP